MGSVVTLFVRMNMEVYSKPMAKGVSSIKSGDLELVNISPHIPIRCGDTDVLTTNT